ncbi:MULTISPECIES: RHS repeat-associated core domain-containing protein [Pseudomonas]|uniref:RHS repeat-associated core domain-containing protein n=1 Tax=Pseudomonas soli TaxID=1306993 RepID=A0A1H9RH54_9PSED|nr:MULTISPECIES: RHS repeat-associated core domain-containing protein [Pseudomonas]MCX5509815.1 RHS repeat-associated core domain-containing protein [Pseudomonas sp. BJa3]WJO24575.1 RHS repeat-associated core domain-containing protein [Pseudomonas soli]SER72141.1 RHS repeat-associated core domain-containing protein [Pseudomonas soli]
MPHSRLLYTDAHGSVLRAQGETGQSVLAYTVHGHDARTRPVSPFLRFNGQAPEKLSGNYLLGNGYRTYSPTLLRFTSPDGLSPFGEGGLNAYAYCAGDPINSVDPSGHAPGKKRNPTGGWLLVKKFVRKKLALVEDATTFAKLFVEVLKKPTWSNRWAVVKQTGKMAIKYGPVAPVYWVYDWLRPTPSVPDQVTAPSVPAAPHAGAPNGPADGQSPSDTRNKLRGDST